MRLDNDGFGVCLKQAIRVQGEVDWSPHTVDYAAFKQFLKKICRRRYEIRSMLRKSPDGKLSEDFFSQVLGTPVMFDIGEKELPNPASDGGEDEAANDYINLLDMESVAAPEINSKPSLGDNKSKRRSRATVLRTLSLVERRELIGYLQSEMNKVQMFYLSQWQRISTMLEQQDPSDHEFHVIGDEILEEHYAPVAAAIRFAEEMRKRAKGKIT